MATEEKTFVDEIGVYPTHIRAVIWDSIKQAEIFVTKNGEKRSTTVGFVLKGKQINDFIKFLSKAGSEKMIVTPNFYYECPDCGFITKEKPTKEHDTTRHECK